MVDQVEIHRMAQSEDVEERKRAAKELEYSFSILKDKKQAWDDLHKLTYDTESNVCSGAVSAIGSTFSHLPDKKQAWDDLIRLTYNIDEYVRMVAASALGSAFEHVPDKKQAWNDLIRLASDTDSIVHWGTAFALGSAFAHVPDKKQAWDDLHRLTSDTDSGVRRVAAFAIGSAFEHVPDKKQAWDDLHKLTSDTDSGVRSDAAFAIGSAFAHVPDKKQAWDDLHKLTSDTDSGVRSDAADAIGSAFAYVPDKKQSWNDLHKLTSDTDWIVRSKAVSALGSTFAHVPDKKQAWEDLIRLASDTNWYVRRGAASALGSAFARVPDKKQAWNDLIRLTSDTDRGVRIAANHSSGKACIFSAIEAESEEDLRNEIEKALEYFEEAAKEAIFFNPASFCLPFYRSFYTLTFKKEEAGAEVQRYFSEAKSAVIGSKSKEKLLDAIENLGNALKEAQEGQDFNEMKSDLNACRRYLERACELLDTTEEKAPGASRLIRMGLPIIDERIKGVIAEIQEKAKALYKQVKDTEYKEIGQQVNNVGQELSKVIDPIRLEKEVSHMLIPLSAMCKKMPEEDRGEACEILKQINGEQNVEDKLPLISMFLSKISTQMSKEPIIGNIHIENSEGVQVIVGTGNKQVQDSNSSPK